MRKTPKPQWLRTKSPSYQRLWGECIFCKRLLWKPALKRGHYKKDGCDHMVLPHPLPPPPLYSSVLNPDQPCCICGKKGCSHLTGSRP